MMIISIIGLAYLFYEGVEWINYRIKVKALIKTLQKLNKDYLKRDIYESFERHLWQNRYI